MSINLADPTTAVAAYEANATAIAEQTRLVRELGQMMRAPIETAMASAAQSYANVFSVAAMQLDTNVLTHIDKSIFLSSQGAAESVAMADASILALKTQSLYEWSVGVNDPLVHFGNVAAGPSVNISGTIDSLSASQQYSAIGLLPASECCSVTNSFLAAQSFSVASATLPTNLLNLEGIFDMAQQAGKTVANANAIAEQASSFDNGLLKSATESLKLAVTDAAGSQHWIECAQASLDMALPRPYSPPLTLSPPHSSIYNTKLMSLGQIITHSPVSHSAEVWLCLNCGDDSFILAGAMEDVRIGCVGCGKVLSRREILVKSLSRKQSGEKHLGRAVGS